LREPSRFSLKEANSHPRIVEGSEFESADPAFAGETRITVSFTHAEWRN